MEPTTLEVLLVVALATLFRSAFGFGEALIAVPLLTLFLPVKSCSPTCCAGVDYDCRGGGGTGLAEDPLAQRGMVGRGFAFWHSCGAVAADEQPPASSENCAGDFHHGFFGIFPAGPQVAGVEERQ